MENVTENVFRWAERNSGRALRLSLGVVLLWIGALKFADPTPVVELLGASFVVAALLLFAGIATGWVGLLCAGLFAGTLTIFVIAPAVSFGAAGFPSLTLAGQFLLKDLVLLAVSIAIAGQAAHGAIATPAPREKSARALAH